MKSLTATEVARQLSEVLDAVEQRGETFVVSRRGRAVATIGPAPGATGRRLKEVLRRRGPDESWLGELQQLRAQLTVEERRWRD